MHQECNIQVQQNQLVEKMTNGGQILLESGFEYETIRTLMSQGHLVGFGLGNYSG